ncbi:M56 family metallopeptidase [Flavobacterium silvaticum]|uniref:Peptidase M56 domain-containing protein n=1 Tax=Flavobacterium silvaticum TaxID=1852020 RepID=A0A972JK91_9FLAO|nr:M56 family metallopeptidase [Flavobacterium silvaticum]NMH28902.1 hypothetical protein [Flavobacterium silvaticum]
MEAVTLYCLKSGALLVAFFLAYYVFLRKETFFLANRWYLLAGLLTAAVLPFVQFKKIVYVEPQNIPVNFPVDTFSDTASALPVSAISTMNPVAVEAEPFNWMLLLTVIYCLIAAFLLMKLGVEFFQLKRLLKGKSADSNKGLKFYDVPEDITPFSYFGNIVFNSSLYTQEELDNILRHERVHSSQWHSVDVLLSRVFCIFFWWNPISWFYHKAILQNLEFIADSEAIREIGDKRSYQYTLLKITTPVNGLSKTTISNHFFQSLIKKRIVMLNKNQSSKWNSWKYLLILPVLAAFLLSFQVRTISLEKPLKAIVGKAFSMDEIDIRITKNTSDEELKEFTTEAKRNDIKLKINKVKRNAKGEIIAIKVEFKDKYGKTGTTQVESDQPIQPIRFFRDSNGLAGFGKPSDSRFVYFKDDNSDNEGDNADNEGDNGDESFTYGLAVEVPEPPEAPEAPEIGEAPEAPEPPEFSWSKSGSDNKTIVITTKDGKTRTISGDDAMNFSSNYIIAQINPDDIASVSITSDNDNIRINGDALVTNISKITSKEIKKAMKLAKDEVKRAEPEIRRAMQESRIQIEKATRDFNKDVQRDKEMNKNQSRKAREESREQMERAMQEARHQMEEAKEEMKKAKAEMDKARAELEAERAKKK